MTKLPAHIHWCDKEHEPEVVFLERIPLKEFSSNIRELLEESYIRKDYEEAAEREIVRRERAKLRKAKTRMPA